MIVIHAVQKLLNISRLKPALFISAAAENQEMHSWYAKIISTSFRGKLLVMYVHQPSLLLVLTRGKTISGTLPEFYDRIESLLIRTKFKPSFIEHELAMIREGHVISKTDSKSMLASMNAITYNIEARCLDYADYDDLEIDALEDSYTRWLVQDKIAVNGYRRILDYWKDKGVVLM